MGSLRIRSLTIAAVIAASASGLVLTGGPANAALPYCNNVSGVTDAAAGLTRYETYVNSSGNYTVSCDMNWINENGNAGQRRAIRQIQWDLVMCYGKSISIDGEYGPLTRQAVREVQSYLNQFGAGLVVDGWAGPNTRKKMAHVATEETFCVNTPNPTIWPGYEWLDVPYF
jgi:Putative peptidoglycan binding domain